jgi:hypothetical protein
MSDPEVGPSVAVINPYPALLLNHFTLPVVGVTVVDVSMLDVLIIDL